MDLKFRALRPDEISVRVSQVKNNGVTLLLYKDARCDMDILDETVGPMSWTRSHSRDNANCTVAIYDTDTLMWVMKEDTGTESNTEKEKGLASDSFKRACVNWGIGRELYTAPFIFVPADKCNIQTNPRTGNPVCYDRFEVNDIDYDLNREITSLSIVKVERGNRIPVYSYGGGRKAPAQAPVAPAPTQEAVTCERCQKPIVPTKKRDGSIWGVADMVSYSNGRFGGTYCADCMKALQKAEKARKGRTRMADIAAGED